MAFLKSVNTLVAIFFCLSPTLFALKSIRIIDDLQPGLQTETSYLIKLGDSPDQLILVSDSMSTHPAENQPILTITTFGGVNRGLLGEYIASTGRDFERSEYTFALKLNVLKDSRECAKLPNSSFICTMILSLPRQPKGHADLPFYVQFQNTSNDGEQTPTLTAELFAPSFSGSDNEDHVIRTSYYRQKVAHSSTGRVLLGGDCMSIVENKSVVAIPDLHVKVWFVEGDSLTTRFIMRECHGEPREVLPWDGENIAGTNCFKLPKLEFSKPQEKCKLTAVFSDEAGEVIMPYTAENWLDTVYSENDPIQNVTLYHPSKSRAELPSAESYGVIIGCFVAAVLAMICTGAAVWRRWKSQSFSLDIPGLAPERRMAFVTNTEPAKVEVMIELQENKVTEQL